MRIPKIARKKTPSVAARRAWLELYYKKNISVESIAHDYGYPLTTVYYWLRKMDPKRKERSDKGKKAKSPTLDLPDISQLTLDGQSLESSIEMIINALIQSITANKKVKLNGATTAINQLTLNLSRLRAMQFEGFAKNLDAQIVKRIIRRYEPMATDMRIIEIFKEERARMKSEKT